MKIEKIIPKELEEISCAAEIGITEIDDTPCLVARGPKKGGGIHYMIIPADLLGKHLYELFGRPMDGLIRESQIQSNN